MVGSRQVDRVFLDVAFYFLLTKKRQITELSYVYESNTSRQLELKWLNEPYMIPVEKNVLMFIKMF